MVIACTVVEIESNVWNVVVELVGCMVVVVVVVKARTAESRRN